MKNIYLYIYILLLQAIIYQSSFYINMLNLQKVNNTAEYLINHYYQQELQQKNISYFIADKLNNSGLWRNRRFFILYGQQFFGYSRSIEPTQVIPFKSIFDIPTPKIKLDLEYITDINGLQQEPILIIKFISPQDKTQKYWNIKVDNKQMLAIIYKKLFKTIDNKFPIITPEQFKTMRQEDNPKNEQFQSKKEPIKKKFATVVESRINDPQKNMCKICLCKEALYVNMNCLHLSLCQTCRPKIQKKCPICRTDGDFKRIFK